MMENRPQAPITILHISDIHVQGVEEMNMLGQLGADVQRLMADFRLKPQIIIASGDLTQRASRSEFDKVIVELDKLRSILSLSRNEVVLIPGNHDINWDACKLAFGRRPPQAQPYADKWKNFASFYDSFYSNKKEGDHHFTLEQPWSLFEFPSIHTVVAAVNSTWAESHKNCDHYGFIGDDQLQWFKKKLNNYNDRDWLCITVLHHNVAPQREDKSSLLDRANFTSDVLTHAHFVLHGHTHLGDPSFGASPPVLSTGTASSGAKTRPVETPNQYQIIQIWPDHYKRWTRSYSLQMHRWIGDCSVSRFGNDWRAEIAHDSRAIFGTPWLVSASASAAIDFIDAGDPVTAQAILSYADSSLDIKHYLPIIQLKQKFGIHAQADVAELNEKILLSEENWDNDAYRELRITKVKLLSQDGLWDEVDGERVTCENLQSKTPTKARGVMHRLAFAEAIQRGFSGTVEGYFKESIAISRAATDGREVNQHSVITSEVLLEISRYFCSKSDGPLGVSDVVAKLAEAQQTYLRAHYDFSVGQAFPVKSAIQVLFAEAAFLLYENNESPSGWNRLLAANLLVSRYFFSPLSEGYAELLHAVYGEKHWCNNMKSEAVVRKRKKLRELLESAMQTNRSQRLKFLKEVVEGIRRTQLLEMIEIFRLVPAHSPNPSDWKRLREFFDRCDNKFFFNDSIRHA